MIARSAAHQVKYYVLAVSEWFSHGLGRVEMWRGGCRPNISVAAPFVWRCLTGSAVAPFPHTGARAWRARLRFPQNVACGSPALRSSEVDLQHCKSLQLAIREIQFRSQ